MSSDLYPGDVIKLEQGDEVPADGFLMKVTNRRNCCYFETTNIDNDLNLVKKTMPQFKEGLNEDDPIEFVNLYVNNTVICDPPNPDHHSFNGILKTVGASVRLSTGKTHQKISLWRVRSCARPLRLFWLWFTRVRIAKLCRTIAAPRINVRA